MVIDNLTDSKTTSMVSSEQLDTIVEYLKTVKNEGDVMLIGEKRVRGRGAF